MATLAQKYAWLLETLRRRGPLSLRELDELWKETDTLNPYRKGFDRSKLNRWRKGVYEQFSVEIKCELTGSYRYYIEDAEEVLNKNNVNTFVLENLSLSNTLEEYKGMGNRIVTDPSPSGLEHLPEILRAMKDCISIDVLYENVNNSRFTITLEPYALREHQKRWYVLGRIPQFDSLMLLQLDRIRAVETRSQDYYEIPTDFDADEFFAQFYGAVINSNYPTQRIVIRAYGAQITSLRDVPLHFSQKELQNENERISDFSYYIVPTYDFTERIVSLGASVEVIKPEEYRQQIKDFIANSMRRYEDEETPLDEDQINKPLNGTFAVINLEVANKHYSSICELTIIILHNGKIEKRGHSFIKPMPGYFEESNTELTGLSEKDVEDFPLFPEVWNKIKDDIQGLPLVAYNARFEKRVLEAAFEAYGLDIPKIEWINLLKSARNLIFNLPTYRLQTVSGAFGNPGKSLKTLEMTEQIAALALQLL